MASRVVKVPKMRPVAEIVHALRTHGERGTGTLRGLRGGCLHPARGRERHALRALLRRAPGPLSRERT